MVVLYIMESTIQIILIICVVSLTAIFVTAGVWVILILREFRKVTQKISKVGDDVDETSLFVKEKIKDGFSMMALLATLSTLWSKRDKIGDVLPDIKNKIANSDEQTVNGVEEEDDKEETEGSIQKAEGKEEKENKKKKRKFFFRKKK